MNECIYFKNQNNIMFKGREHIFPAGLGGIQTLPEGYVSKEANDYFSKLEDHLMHYSLISTTRMMVGPPKRKDKQEGKRIVLLLENNRGRSMRV